jgi:hypothetical protein
LEAKRASDFSDLRTAKTAEINNGEASAEAKEDELAKTDNELAEAKEDLGQTKKTLADDTKFEENLQKTWDEAVANYDERKTARESEMKAVSETVAILSDDLAKDAMKGTFNKAKSFIQLSSHSQSKRRARVAALLRRQAARSNNAEMALLASSAELDTFAKVKLMIDKMVEQLKVQQADEVKKNDFCTSEIQSNDMATLKANDRKEDLDASVADLQATIEKIEGETEQAKKDISKEQVSLQTATENRKKENLEFQKTISDQTLTIEVLEKAMDRLATYYDEAALVQTGATHKAAPAPGAQSKYKKSAGSAGALSMIEKLIYDAKEIMADSKKAESEAQAAYEALVNDSNDTIKSLTKQVLSKTDAKVETKKDKSEKQVDLKATVAEQESLSKTNTDLHNECDFVMKNFGVRQKARGDEVVALQQAKNILNGASV